MDIDLIICVNHVTIIYGIIEIISQLTAKKYLTKINPSTMVPTYGAGMNYTIFLLQSKETQRKTKFGKIGIDVFEEEPDEELSHELNNLFALLEYIIS